MIFFMFFVLMHEVGLLLPKKLVTKLVFFVLMHEVGLLLPKKLVT